VYDANEVVAIPLCKEALDYCCSTTMVKNEFMSFWEVSIFFQGGPDVNKKAHMTLFSCSRWKRENAAEDFLLGRNP
jgi:hypothetical protein